MLVYGLVCGVLWTLPLVGLLHVESSAIVAGVAFFAAGLSALGAFGQGASLRAVLVRQEALLVVPCQEALVAGVAGGAHLAPVVRERGDNHVPFGPLARPGNGGDNKPVG